MQRGGEVADMRWQDVDLDGGWWTIPADRAKNGLPHRVPQTLKAVEIIKALKPQGSQYR
jgi:integrase